MTDWLAEVKEHAKRALPPVEGEVKVDGLREPVEIIRDRWGVPHIYAKNFEDLFFAQGYVQASERLFQIDFTLRLANGRLASMVSEMGLLLDRFIRTIGFHRAAQRITKTYDDRSLEMIDAFQRGLRAWVQTMPAPPVEYRILDLEPEELPTGDEGAAYGAAGAVFMAWALSTNWDAELLRAEIADKLGWEATRALFPGLPTEPAIVIAGKEHGVEGRRSALDILRTAPITPKGQGSNNWVVAGSRTATGKPLLANDPHLMVQLPAVWFECHLSAPGFEVSGVALPFTPGITIGHTARHAWGSRMWAETRRTCTWNGCPMTGDRHCTTGSGSRSRSIARRSRFGGARNRRSSRFGRAATARSSTPTWSASAVPRS